MEHTFLDPMGDVAAKISFKPDRSLIGSENIGSTDEFKGPATELQLATSPTSRDDAGVGAGCPRGLQEEI